jgi:preprotein translocase subunit SecD
VLQACLAQNPKATSGIGGDNMTCLVVLLNIDDKKNNIGTSEIIEKDKENNVKTTIVCGSESEVLKNEKKNDIFQVIKSDEIIDGDKLDNEGATGGKEKEENVLDENLEKKKRKNNFKFQLSNYIREYL